MKYQTGRICIKCGNAFKRRTEYVLHKNELKKCENCANEIVRKHFSTQEKNTKKARKPAYMVTIKENGKIGVEADKDTYVYKNEVNVSKENIYSNLRFINFYQSDVETISINDTERKITIWLRTRNEDE